MMKLNIQLFAVSKSTTFSESNINEEKNTSSLTINIYFSANNSSTFFTNYPLKCTCNGASQTKNVSHPKGGSCSVSFTFNNIKHNSDGSKSVSWSWSCATGTSVLGTIKDSGTKELTKIDRASEFDLSKSNTDTIPFETSRSLYINKENDNFYNTLEIKSVFVDKTYYRENIQEGEYILTFTQEELNETFDLLTYLNYGMYELRLITYEDSTKEVPIGEPSVLSVIYTIINANPIFNNFTYEDSNSTTIALTNNSNKIVQGYSTLKVTIPVKDKATGQKGATISGYNIGNYSVAYSDTTDVVKEIPNYQNENIVVSAVDSRGNSKSITKLFTDNFINYTDLVILNCEVSREDEIGEQVKIKFDGTWWSSNFGGANGGGVLNELTAIYQYQTGNGEFINGTTPLTLNISEFGKFSCEQYIVGDTGNGFNISNSYNIRIIVSDKLSSKSNTKELIAGEPAIAIFGNKIALHNKYDESREDIPIQLYGNSDVQGNFTINGKNVYPNQNIICVTNSSEYILKETNIYEQIQNLVIENQLGSDLSLVDNAIVIGKGISKVIANFSLIYDGSGGVGSKFVRLSKNEIDNAYRMVSKSTFSTSGTQNYRIFMDSGEVLIDVVEGDKIMLFAYGTKNDEIARNTYNYFIFTVRAVA